MNCKTFFCRIYIILVILLFSKLVSGVNETTNNFSKNNQIQIKPKNIFKKFLKKCFQIFQNEKIKPMPWEKIPSGILSIIFKFLQHPKEFKQFVLFLEISFPTEMEKKLKILPQKLTKKFLHYRIHNFRENLTLIEYYRPLWDSTSENFEIIHMIEIQNKVKFILYENKFLECESLMSTPPNVEFRSYSNDFIDLKPFPENWNENIYLMWVKRSGTIQIININLGIKIYIHYIEPKNTLFLHVYTLCPYKFYPYKHPEFYDLF